MNKRVLHLVGNAHLDPVWLWRWPEGYEAARATFESALSLIEENDDFIFTSSQAAVYQWIERGDPDLFQRIKERVREGRWIIVGGCWMQSDCNIPSGESLVRQGLYGQRYFQEKLGVMATVGYNVDSFGHNAMIPQILKGLGMGYYVFMRPGRHENADVPDRLFWWESPDGSRVLAYKIHRAYGGDGAFLEGHLRETVEQTTRYPVLMGFYGVGNHGGGPTRGNFALIERLRRDAPDMDVLYSSPGPFFAEVSKDDLPVWSDELQHHASGCYAVHSEIKQNNRKLEHLLEAAEKFSVMAQAFAVRRSPDPAQGQTEGLPIRDPKPEIRDSLTSAWQAVLFNQFHDILAGTSVKEAYDDARDLHGAALQAANEAITYSAGAVARTIDTSGAGMPVVVLNPHSWQVSDYCECEIHGSPAPLCVTDEHGSVVPCQAVATSALVEWSSRNRVVFPVEVGPLGYRLYRVHHEESPPHPDPLPPGGEGALENEFLRVELDSDTGQPASVFDKRRGVEAMAMPGCARVIDDPSDTWSHGVFRFDKAIGIFGDAMMETVERGPVRSAVRITLRYESSTLAQTYRLYSGAPWLECECEVDWRERRKMLKLVFSVNVKDPLVTYEIPYGHIQRPANGEEEPGLRWLDVSDQSGGLCLANDAKYSYSVEGNALNLTVLRSPVYAHHEPRKLEPGGHFAYIDQGIQRFRYRLLPHSGSWQDCSPFRFASELNLPPIAALQSYHQGGAAPAASFLSVSEASVIVSVIKQAEEGDDIVLRAFETDGRPAKCVFTLRRPGITWEADFRPCEIRTFRVTEGGVAETDLLERING